MIRLSRKSLSIMCSIAFLTSGIYAKFTPSTSLTIAVIDENKLVNETSASNICKEKIEAERARIEKEVGTMVQKFESSKGEFANKKATMSDTARAQEEERLLKMYNECEAAYRSGNDTMQRIFEREKGNLGKMISEGAKEFAQANKVDLVLDKTSGRVWYADPKFDATQDIFAVMEKKYTQPSATTKTPEQKPASSATTTPATSSPVKK
jgi:Skp family chaperone for outer membrane proteins